MAEPNEPRNPLSAKLNPWRELNRLRAEAAQAQEELGRLRKEHAEWTRFAPPGHFYSPVPSREDIAEAFARNDSGPPFPGVDLNEAAQVARLERFIPWYAGQPFRAEPSPERRYHFENGSYGRFDAIMLYCMLREARPRRIIEVGSGFSSAAMLDINDHALGGSMKLTCIDPDLSRVQRLLRPRSTNSSEPARRRSSHPSARCNIGGRST